MIINSYSVAMGSKRKSESVYTTEVEQTSTQKETKRATKSYSKDILTISEEAREFLAKRFDKTNSENNNEYTSSDSGENSEKKNDNVSSYVPPIALTTGTSASDCMKIEDTKTIALKLILQMLDSLNGDNKLQKDFEKLFPSSFNDVLKANDDAKAYFKRTAQNSSENSASDVWTIQRKESVFLKQQEVTEFSSTGFVKTADGRSVSFNVSIEMSRNFEAYIKRESTTKDVVMKDPLVINLISAPAKVSDQTFLFDIDADGIKDEISMLENGSGFLALDKNEDGKINDGNELFGALTGNGFDELSKYDDDGNGWIDEADSIFNKLKIWTKDEKGKDLLISLKDSGVGAIYLSNASTKFDINNIATNETNAQVRSTGVYLKENGEAGTIQQLDFAVKNQNS